MNHEGAELMAVDGYLSRMTLEEKIGQCLTLLWRGPFITQSVVETITRLHVGGLRIEPIFMESALRNYYGHDASAKGYVNPEGYFTIAESYFRPDDKAVSVTARDYAEKLNRLKEIAMQRPSGVPLHIATDFEGDFSRDWPFDDIKIFPSNMGLCATGSPTLAYKTGRAVAEQLAAIGINIIHSPVCDINTNPRNPEIGTRSFSSDPDQCYAYISRLWQGLEDGGLIATAKHFPGRGNSDVDAHYELPVSSGDREQMNAVELTPYRRLIRKGLRAVMTAHSAYPALDPSGLPATLSQRILNDVLRDELGFDGVITTDAMGMGAIAKKYGVPVGCAMALKAGCDLVLVKFEGELRSQVFFEIKRWVDEGRLTEEELDSKVRRILLMKHRQGLFDTGGVVDAAKTDAVLKDEHLSNVCSRVARRAITIVRDKQTLLPLTPKKRVMVVEQVGRNGSTPNNSDFHDYILNEEVLNRSLNTVNVTTGFCASEEETQRVLSLAEGVDVIIASNYYRRSIPKNNTALIKALLKKQHRVVVVTNTPYPFGAVPEAGTVVCSFGANPSSARATVDVLFGRRKASAESTKLKW